MHPITNRSVEVSIDHQNRNIISSAQARSRLKGEHPVEQYWIPQHVHLCATGDGIVFLDLRRDKYFGFGGTDLQALAVMVADWPIYADASVQSAVTSEAVEMAQTLVREGLLTRTKSAGKPAAQVALPPVDMQPVCGTSSGRPHRIQPSHVLSFLWACSHAALALRWHSLEAVICDSRKRKEHYQRRNAGGASVAALLELTDIFRRLRSYAFTGKDHCLFHALALTTFLSYHRQFPTWVIGVKTDPFAAHSWVQHDKLVLDDNPEEVCLFTPILAV